MFHRLPLSALQPDKAYTEGETCSEDSAMLPLPLVQAAHRTLANLSSRSGAVVASGVEQAVATLLSLAGSLSGRQDDSSREQLRGVLLALLNLCSGSRAGADTALAHGAFAVLGRCGEAVTAVGDPDGVGCCSAEHIARALGLLVKLSRSGVGPGDRQAADAISRSQASGRLRSGSSDSPEHAHSHCCRTLERIMTAFPASNLAMEAAARSLVRAEKFLAGVCAWPRIPHAPPSLQIDWPGLKGAVVPPRGADG